MTNIKQLKKERKNGSIRALFTLMILAVITRFMGGYNETRDKIAIKTNGIPFLKASCLAPRFNNDEAQVGPIAAILAIVSLAIGAGVFIIVMVIVPGVAGEIITAFNISAENPFYDDVQNVDDKASSNFNLLWVALLVAVATTIISMVAGLIMIFMVKRQ